MNSSRKAIKAITIFTTVITAILFILMLKSEYEHYLTNNIWMEADDKVPTLLIWGVVIAVLVVIPFTILNVMLRQKSKRLVKRTLDFAAIKKGRLTTIKSNLVLIVVLYIVSEEIINSFLVKTLSMSPSEAIYKANSYGIFRTYFLIMLTVMLISDILIFAVVNKGINTVSEDATDDLQDSELEDRMDVHAKENEVNNIMAEQRVIVKRFWIIYIALLLAILIILFLKLYQMTTPSIDMSKYMTGY